MIISRLKTLLAPAFIIGMIVMAPTTSMAACAGAGSSPTAKAIADADYKARTAIALDYVNKQVEIERPESPYGGCIAMTSIDWGQFSNLLSMDAIIKMIKDKMNAALDQACNAVRNLSAEPGRIVNGVLQNGVSQVNSTGSNVLNNYTAPVNNIVNGAYGSAVNLGGGASSAVNGQIGAAGQNANTIVNSIIP